MSRNLRTFTLAMLAFALTLVTTHNLEAAIAVALVVGAGTFFTWRPRGD